MSNIPGLVNRLLRYGVGTTHEKKKIPKGADAYAQAGAYKPGLVLFFWTRGFRTGGRI